MKHTRLGARTALCLEGTLRASSCPWWGVRLLDNCYTGRFLVPYFILIFANVKIKDKSELQQGFNKQEQNTGWINIVWKPFTSNYCVQLLIRHLSSSFIFDAQLLLNLAFLERDGGNNRESCWKPARAAWAFLWQRSVAGVWVFWVLDRLVWFGFLVQWSSWTSGMHYILICFASFHSFRL